MLLKRYLILGLALLFAASFGLLFLVEGNGVELQPTTAWDADDEVPLEEDEVPPESAEAELGEEDLERTELPEATPLLDDGPPERPEITLRGRAVNSYGAPIKGAHINLEIRQRRGPGSRGPGRRGRGRSQRIKKTVETGRDGVFAFSGRGFRHLTVTLIATHQGHAPSIQDRSFEDAEGTLEVGNIVLPIGASVLGSVTDLDDIGIPGATIRVLPAGGNRLAWMRNRNELLPPTRADGNGTFRIEHLMPGPYRIEASANRKERKVTGVLTLQDLREERLEPLRLGPGHLLHGTVFARASGKPLRGADVQLTNLKGRGRDLHDRTDASGRFAFDHLPSWPVMLRVRAKNFVGKTIPEVHPAEEQPVVVTLESGLVLTGIVRDGRTGQPLTRYAARLRRIGDLPEQKAQDVRVKMRGTLELLRSKSKALQQKAQAARKDKSLDGKSKNALRRQSRMIKRKLDATRKVLANVDRKRREREQRERRRRGPRGRGGFFGQVGKIETHEEGRFVFAGLDQGIYQVDLASPEHQRERTAPVELRVGRAAPTLAVALQRGLRVRGVVRSSDDLRAIGNARVDLLRLQENPRTPRPPRPAGGRGDGGARLRSFLHAFRSPGPRMIPVLSTRSDAHGNFSFTQAGNGRYRIAARADGHARKTTETFDLLRDESGIEIRLGPLAVLEGRVLGIPRDQADNARVLAFGGFGRMRTEKVRPDGTYLIDNLEPGSYAVRAFTGGLREFLRQEMHDLLGSKGAAVKVDVVLEEGTRKTLNLVTTLHPVGSLHGTVLHNGVPGKSFRISLQQLDQQGGNSPRPPRPPRGGNRSFRGRGGLFFGAGRMQRTATDQNGEFAFQKLPAGRYDLRVQMRARPPREVYKEEIYIRDGQDTRRQIAVLTGSILGRITARDGAEPASLKGTVQIFAGTSQRPENPKDYSKTGRVTKAAIKGGVFHARDLPSGDAYLLLNLRGRSRVEQAILIGSGGTKTISLFAGPRRAGKGKGPNTGAKGR